MRPGQLPAGDYETVYFFGGEMTVALDQPLSSNEDSTGEFHLTPDEPGPVSRDILFWQDVYPLDPLTGTQVTSVGPRGADLVAWFRTSPYFSVSEPHAGTIGELPATVFDLSLADGVSHAENPDCPSVCAYLVGYPQWEDGYAIATPFPTRWYVADVAYGGQVHLFVVVLITVDAADMATLAPIAEALLATVKVPAMPAPSEAAAGTVTMISKEECAIDLEGDLLPGLIVLNATNLLPMPYAVSFDILRIDEGHTVAEFRRDMDVIRSRLASGEPYADVVADGYPAYASDLQAIELQSGESGQLSGDLTAGTYVIECTSPLHEYGEFVPIMELGPFEVSADE